MFYIIPSPLGSLDDISKKVIDTIKSLDILYCENPSHTSRILSKFDIQGVLLKKYVDQRELILIPQIINDLKSHKKIGLISDAGYPTISDPGYKLIRALVNENINFEVLPGPTSIIPALIYSALPSNKFIFIGFLSKKKNKIKEELESSRGITTIFFESPHRLHKTLNFLEEEYPLSSITICREMSKLHQEIIHGTPKEILDSNKLKDKIKGEITIVIYIP